MDFIQYITPVNENYYDFHKGTYYTVIRQDEKTFEAIDDIGRKHLLSKDLEHTDFIFFRKDSFSKRIF